MIIKGEGMVCIDADVNGEKRSINLENFQLIPNLHMNLLSVSSRIMKHGFRVIFDKNKEQWSLIKMAI